MKTSRTSGAVAIALISIAVIFIGLHATQSAAAPQAALPAPHLGYGLNAWDHPELAAGLGFDWIKLFEEAGPPPATRLPYKVLYRVFADGYPASLESYKQHIRELVQAGLGKVEAYEIGNEVNLSGAGFWGNQAVNPEAYAQLLCEVYPVVKQIDPAAMVVSAGLAPVGRWGPEYWSTVMDERVYAQRLLAGMKSFNNGQFCMDAFGYHPHGFAYTPETDHQAVSNGFAFRGAEAIHDMMLAEGAASMPMWATEFGWIRDPHFDPWIDANGNPSSYGWCNEQIGADIEGFLWMMVTEQQQADYLVRAFQYADAHWPWMGPMFVWNLDLFYRGWSCSPHKFYSIFYAAEGDPNQHLPAPAYDALQAMPKRYASALTVQPAALAFLAEVLTPTVQTRTFQIASAIPGVPVTWTIAVSSSGAVQPIVSPLTGANDATITVRLNTSSITTAGAYSATLFVTAVPTTDDDTPAAVSVSVIAVDQLQRVYAPLIARNFGLPAPPALPTHQELGLSFVSSAESPADEIRYQRALSTEGRLNRWPMYWPAIEKNPVSQPRVFDWSAQDANIIADINHGFTVLPILMLTPIGLDTAGDRSAAPPRVGDGLKTLLNPRSPDRLTRPSSQSSPPQGLYLNIFSDGSDAPGPGKTINPNNRWAFFVNAAVNRYMPGGALAQSQGWGNDKGISYWEVWNEEDLSFFFSGTPTDFARLQKVAYLAARQADPNAVIVLGGLAHFEKPAWLQDVLEVIATDPMSTTYHGFMDAVASHNYSWAYQTYLYLNEDRVRLNNHGLNTVKLWITETGLPVCDDPPYVFCPSTYRGTMSEQADFVIQTIVWSLAKGAEKIVWFQLYDDCGNDGHYDAFGLVRNPSSVPACPLTARDGTPRPAYTTYQLMHELIANARFYRWERRPSALPWTQRTHEVLTFNRPAAHDRVVFLWARHNTPVTAVLTATSTSALLFYPDGSVQTITPVDGVYSITLPAATNYSTPTSDGSAAIGGSPRIVVEYDPTVQP